MKSAKRFCLLAFYFVGVVFILSFQKPTVPNTDIEYYEKAVEFLTNDEEVKVHLDCLFGKKRWKRYSIDKNKRLLFTVGDTLEDISNTCLEAVNFISPPLSKLANPNLSKFSTGEITDLIVYFSSIQAQQVLVEFAFIRQTFGPRKEPILNYHFNTFQGRTLQLLLKFECGKVSIVRHCCIHHD